MSHDLVREETMLYLKQRILAVIIILISAAMLYWTWHDAAANGGYYLKMAIFAPVGVLGGIFLFFFPQYGGKPETGKEKIITLTVFAAGILLGVYNWFLIDPHGFPF
jgi:hypothetical protein